jgi:microcystin-dependent protein
MGAVDTTYTFTATDTITSTKMNNIIDQTTMTTDAIIGTTLDIASGKLKVRSAGITSNELAAEAVTPAATTFANSLLPAGAVMAFAMNSAPSGWIAADGSSVSTSGIYALLFAAIGYTYGGSGGSFNLPDLRGYFVRGSGTNSDGTASGAFGVKQLDDFKSHSHIQLNSALTGNAGTTGTQFGPVRYGSNTVATELSGGTETRPRNIAMLYCIKI